MTNQEMFNKVYQHFIVENNGPSYDASIDACCYRGPNGAKCAAGLFIPDDRYSPRMERQDIKDVVRGFDLSDIFEDINFVVELQHWHDFYLADSGRRMEEGLLKRMLLVIAARSNLELPKGEVIS